MTWNKVKIDVPAVEALSDIVDGTQEGLDAYETVLQTAGAVLKTLAKLKSFGNNQSALIQSAIDAAKDALPEDWLVQVSDVGVYMLDIPLINPFEGGPRSPQIPGNSLKNIMLSALTREYQANITGSGGNYGLYKKIVESIYDPGDLAKPTLTGTSESGLLMLVYGANSAGVAFNLALELDDLFSGALSIPSVTGAVPVPQNVKARPGGNLSDTDAPVVDTGKGDAVDVTIKWDQEPVLRRYLRENPVGIKIVSWHAYVKEGGRIRPGEDLEDYEVFSFDMPTGDVPERAIASNVPHSMTVQNLTYDQAYYISVGYTVEIDDKIQDSRVVLDPKVSTLSDQVRVRLAEQAPPTQHVRGTPPDWRSLRTPAAVLPQLQQAYDRLLDTVDRVEQSYATASNEFTQTVDSAQERLRNIKDSLERIEDVIERFQNKIEEINKTLDDSEAGLWLKTLQISGGRPAFMNDIGSALLDEQENAPPFMDGDAFVGAILLMVEGETLVSVNSVLDVFEKLFGGGEVLTAVTGISQDPVQDITEDDPTLKERQESVTTQDLGMTSEDVSPQEENDAEGGTLADTEIGDDPCEDN